MPDRFFNVIDMMLDRTIVFSYTSIGYALRINTWKVEDISVDMEGRVCLITGASSGLGLAASEGLARLGATVILLVRNADKGQRARDDIIRRTGNKNIVLEIVDLSRLTSVHQFIDRFLDSNKPLHVLINNAGVLLKDKAISVDGCDLSFATNILGPFLLTNQLMPILRKSNPSRIINISSGGMYSQKLDVENLQNNRLPYDGVAAYAQAKRAQVILTEMWAEQLHDTGVTVNAMHPGWVDTPGLRSSLPDFYRIMKPFLRTLEQGIDTMMWLAVAPPVSDITGKFWFDRKQRSTHYFPWTHSSHQDRQRLWDISSALSNLSKNIVPSIE